MIRLSIASARSAAILTARIRHARMAVRLPRQALRRAAAFNAPLGHALDEDPAGAIPIETMLEGVFQMIQMKILGAANIAAIQERTRMLMLTHGRRSLARR
jgi:hypothetical protein